MYNLCDVICVNIALEGLLRWYIGVAARRFYIVAPLSGHQTYTPNDRMCVL